LGIALKKFRESFSTKKIQELMRQEIHEMKELQEVTKELTQLVIQLASEKKMISLELVSERAFREDVIRATED
jgi:hypothetical protein